MKELLIPQLLKSMTLRRIANIFQVMASYAISVALHRHVVWGKPFVITVEPTNHCNLRCPQCSTGSGRSRRAKGDLAVTHFEEVMKQISPFAVYLMLFDQGEPFLHGQLLDFIRIAKSHRLWVTISTNGHFLQQKKFRAQLIDSGLDVLIVSIDGITEETYTQYRRGGNLQRVVQGVKDLTRQRKISGQSLPKVFIQFVVMKHNEHEISQLSHFKRELGADHILLKSAYVEGIDEARLILPTERRFQRYQIEDGNLKVRGARKRPCRRPWFSTVVHWDGSVVPCCFDRDNVYALGNIAQNNFAEIWTSKAYQAFRNEILQNKNGNIDICENCTEGIKIYF